MTTVHLIYPHGDRISCPDAIGRKLGERLAEAYRVLFYDWTESGKIRPGQSDVLVGHPHPAPWTIFRRSARQSSWRRRVILAPYNHVPGQVAFIERTLAHCDLYLAITGRYWVETLTASLFAHWYPKMVHVDLAVDRNDFPVLKQHINPPAQRRFLYIGHASPTKNVEYLGQIARAMPESVFSWIGIGRPVEGLRPLGVHDFRTDDAKRVVADHDFLVSPARADANPASILEAMAWGLVPVCTPMSGYVGQKGIVNIPLDDVAGASEILRMLQYAPEEELRAMQDVNWRALDVHFNWDRFARQVVSAIESKASPPLEHPSVLNKTRIAFASALDRRSAGFRIRAIPRPRHDRVAAPVATRPSVDTCAREVAPHAVEKAVCALRNDPSFFELVRDAYLGVDVVDAAERFAASAEFADVRRLLADRVRGSCILDLGAGRGIASFAFARTGAELIYSLEPDPSDVVGRGAIATLTDAEDLPIRMLDGIGEAIPLEDASVDIVYARQVLHHAQDLSAVAHECARVLRPAGTFLACREHVVDDQRQLERFLAGHPVHRLAGGEHAYSLTEYSAAITGAGLQIERILGPWDSIINAFPLVRSEHELEHYPEVILERYLGIVGKSVARTRAVRKLVFQTLRLRRRPGRLYTFLATKPAP